MLSFEKNLKKLVDSRINMAFSPLLDIHFDGIAKTKRAVLLLFKTQESGIKRAVMIWKYQSEKVKEALRCKYILKFLEQFNNFATITIAPFFEDERATNIKIKAIK